MAVAVYSTDTSGLTEYRDGLWDPKFRHSIYPDGQGFLIPDHDHLEPTGMRRRMPLTEIAQVDCGRSGTESDDLKSVTPLWEALRSEK